MSVHNRDEYATRARAHANIAVNATQTYEYSPTMQHISFSKKGGTKYKSFSATTEPEFTASHGCSYVAVRIKAAPLCKTRSKDAHAPSFMGVSDWLRTGEALHRSELVTLAPEVVSKGNLGKVGQKNVPRYLT